MALRRDPRMLKVPPYLSLLCICVGLIWLLLLPLDDYSRRTYISENALLPGQVHTYFGGSEQNIFRGYRQEVDTLSARDNYEYISTMNPCRELPNYGKWLTYFSKQNQRQPRGDAEKHGRQGRASKLHI